jgi:hypothetical protein
MKAKFTVFFSILMSASMIQAHGLLCDPGSGLNAVSITQQTNLSPVAKDFDCSDELQAQVNPTKPNIRRVEFINDGRPQNVRLYNPDNLGLYPYRGVTGVFRIGMHRNSMRHGMERKILALQTFNPTTLSTELGEASVLIVEKTRTDGSRFLEVMLTTRETNETNLREYLLGCIDYGTEPGMSPLLDYRFKINMYQAVSGGSVYALECFKINATLCVSNNVHSAGPVSTNVIAQEDLLLEFSGRESDEQLISGDSSDLSPNMIVKMVW